MTPDETKSEEETNPTIDEVVLITEPAEEIEPNWNKELALTLREMQQELKLIREARSQSSQSQPEPEPEPETEPETIEIVVEDVQPETEKSPYRSLKSSRHQSG